MKKNLAKKIFVSILLVFVVFCFWKISNINFIKHREIQENLIDKPEFLPTKFSSKATSFGFKNLKADYYWVQTIQYIGGNVISETYKEYLFSMIDLITELNPYFVEPYKIGELLLPSYNPRYENTTEKQRENYKNQALEIGLKGLKNFCDAKKIEEIDKIDDLEELFNNKDLKNPCLEPEIVYNLAYIYSFYFKDYKNAVKYYKVASVTDGVPSGAKNLIGILAGKSGDRKKSFFMFLNMINYTGKDDEICQTFNQILTNFGNEFFNEEKIQSGKILAEIEKIRKEYFTENEGVFDSTTCGNYVNKAVRELNLYYLDKANKSYFEKNQINAENPNILFEAKEIDYIPVDYQQYDTYGIKYIFNTDLNSFDAKMLNNE